MWFKRGFLSAAPRAVIDVEDGIVFKKNLCKEVHILTNNSSVIYNPLLV